MSLNFSELIIWLLPGFLGLWVFKRIVQENLDERGEITQGAIALLLALASLFMLFLTGHLTDKVSIDALSLRNEDISFQWWLSYGVLCFYSLLLGFLFGIICEKGLSPTRFLPSIAGKILKRCVKRGCESGLRFLVDDMSEHGHGPYLTRVYMLGENRDNPLIGWWSGYSESGKEIVLDRLELCDADPQLKKLLDLQPRNCCINHESGLVIEFLDWDKKQDEKFDAYLRTQYQYAVSQCKERD